MYYLNVVEKGREPDERGGGLQSTNCNEKSGCPSARGRKVYYPNVLEKCRIQDAAGKESQPTKDITKAVTTTPRGERWISQKGGNEGLLETRRVREPQQQKRLQVSQHKTTDAAHTYN